MLERREKAPWVHDRYRARGLWDPDACLAIAFSTCLRKGAHHGGIKRHVCSHPVKLLKS